MLYVDVLFILDVLFCLQFEAAKDSIMEYELSSVEPDYILPDPSDVLTPDIQPIQIVALVLYGLVALLGIPGNALVIWVTGFCMPRSVTSLWFLNLAVADLLCCLSLPLLMVPIAHDDHWHFGPLACTLVKSLFYLVMFCSILQLVLISVDRWMLVSKPVWCQNHRQPKQAAIGCAAVWLLALIGTIPQFIFTKEIQAGYDKRECVTKYTEFNAWLITSYRFLVGFFLPFLVIVLCHLVVYRRAKSGLSNRRSGSKRTVKVILAVVLSFFLCWLPLHIVDFITLVTPRSSPDSPKVYLSQVLTLCLAYFNSCLNPLLYVCLGKAFKQNMNRSLRNILSFIGEDTVVRASISKCDTKSTSNGKEMTKI